MMKSIYLNDGTNVLIFNTEDAINVIKNNLSDELAKYISDMMEVMKEEMEEAIFGYNDLCSHFDDLDEENTKLINENCRLENKVRELEKQLKIMEFKMTDNEDDNSFKDELPFC